MLCQSFPYVYFNVYLFFLYWYYELLGWLLLIALFLQIWQNYADGMSILALSLLARYCVKSTMMDLSPNNYGLQKHIVKKFRKNK